VEDSYSFQSKRASLPLLVKLHPKVREALDDLAVAEDCTLQALIAGLLADGLDARLRHVERKTA
jgi:hypothetical protein